MEKLQKKNSPVLLVKKVTDSAYGYIYSKDKKVTEVVEKPQEILDSMKKIIGIYLLNKAFLTTLEETPTEHYHFEKALDTYAKSQDVFFLETQKPTVTLKYASDLFVLKDYILGNIQKPFIAKSAQIAKSAEIIGNVYIDDGAKVLEHASIKGPCYIGKNAIVGGFALVRNGVSLEEGGVIGARMEMKNTLVMQNSTTHSGFIGDSLIGKDTKIAAQMYTANARLDRKSIALTIKGEKVNSGMNHFGVLIGNNANLGIAVSTMPGVIIGNNTIIGPSTTVMKNVPDNTKYYTKFQEIIEESNEK